MSQLKWSHTHVWGFPVILTEGGHVDGCGKIVGAFDSEDAARSDDPDSAVIGTLSWDGIGDELRADATHNTRVLSGEAE